MTAALAVHVGADLAFVDGVQRWPRSVAALDTVRRAEAICSRAGIATQHVRTGPAATRAALRQLLRDAATTLADDGLLVLTFSGHTVRGDGPLATSRWCLYDGGVPLAELAAALAHLPATARLVIVCDSCHALAIAHCLTGPQRIVVIAGCGDDQTMLARRRSEFVVRLEDLLAEPTLSLADVWRSLARDTPDCERPAVWTNTDAWWLAPARSLLTS